GVNDHGPGTGSLFPRGAWGLSPRTETAARQSAGKNVPVPLAGRERLPEGSDMNTGLKGNVALITGSAHGQGRAAALALAREGVQIAALDVAKQLDYPGYATGTSAELDAVVAECRAAGVAALPFADDVRDDAAVSRAVAETVQQLGRIDILFNNAGICGYGLAHELGEEAWDAMLDINLKGAWLVPRPGIPHL